MAADHNAGVAWLMAGRHAGCRLGGRVSRGLGWLVAGAEEGVGDRFLQGVPRSGDDVLVHADRAPHVVGGAVAVAGFDEHPGHGAGPVRALQDADLVVGQLQPGQLRVEPLQREAQGVVERVDRPVALAGGHDPLALGLQLHGGLADHLAARAPLDDDAPRLDLEVAQPLPASSSRSSSSKEASAASKVYPWASRSLTRSTTRPTVALS